MDMFYEIDFRTLEHHKGIEDFRITNEDDSKICIGEAKGKHRDIMKPDLLKVEANGDAAGKDQALFLYSHHPHLVKIHQIHHRDIILMLLHRRGMGRKNWDSCCMQGPI